VHVIQHPLPPPSYQTKSCDREDVSVTRCEIEREREREIEREREREKERERERERKDRESKGVGTKPRVLSVTAPHRRKPLLLPTML
jgi:hypothetical protein